MGSEEEAFNGEDAAAPSNKEEFEKKEKELKQKYGVTEEIPERHLKLEVEAPSRLPREQKEIDLPEILLKVEKLDGKLDVLKDFKENIEERMGVMSGNIGEMRSMLLEKEKFLSKVEKDMEMVMESVSSLETDKIKKQFLKRDTDLEEIKADIEKLESMVMTVQGENRKFLGTMEKIKDVENLVNTSSRIEEKLSKIEDAKAYSERVASKVEAIFSELSEKMVELDRKKEKIDKVDELTVDIVKMLDGMSVKFTNFVEKGEFDKIRSDIDKKIGAMSGASLDTSNFVQRAELQKSRAELDRRFAELAALDKARLANFIDRGEMERLRIDFSRKVDAMVGKAEFDRWKAEVVRELQMLSDADRRPANFLDRGEFERFRSGVDKKLENTYSGRAEAPAHAQQPSEDAFSSLKEKWRGKFSKEQLIGAQE